ncbi:Ig-like domain-containing protein [Breznakia pachnodae]|uniref:SDR-like Ig domain-containing protein n=1 Tax=Breznakia pachnodae TaxID=265178 RepID=A0ABU0E6V7_9FIRM|nr:Ig-like domain-containing protein [Breznakia pachnodae]MDQ0362634.1 hypothetical protein [Breznakia pachnodae]
MKVKKLTKIIKGMLAVLIAFTAVTLFDGEISAAEEFDIQSKVTYGENNANAVISLDLSSIHKEYTVETIKDPDGNTMDLTDFKYNVMENGTYNFYVSYFDGSNTKHEYTKMVTVENIKTVDRSGLTRSTTDYTNQVEVIDWDILDDDKNPLNNINEAIPNSRYQLRIDWILNVKNGGLLFEGDTFSINMPKNQTSGEWAVVNTEWENFTDNDDITVLGQWRIHGNKIEVKLNENVEGKQSIKGNFITGNNALYNGTVLGGIQDVKLGDIIKQIKFKQSSLSPISGKDVKQAGTTSNSVISWVFNLNGSSLNELIQKPYGRTFTDVGDMYIEDTLNGRFAGGFTVSATLQVPVDLIDGLPSGDAVRVYGITFNQIYPESKQSYEDFKNSLEPLEWGIYEGENDVQTLVIYFGSIGKDGVKYSDIDPDFAKNSANSAIKNGYYSESDRALLEQYYTEVYGDGNAIEGKIVKYRVSFQESYDKVVIDSQQTNVATVTKGNVLTNLTGKGTLEGVSGSASTVDSSKARVYLSDYNTNVALNGVFMELQRYDGTTWEEYSVWSGSTTNTDGYVDTTAIGDGTYRFVQQGAYSNEYDLQNSDGYDTGLGKVVSEAFTISSTDPEGKTVYMTNVKYKYDVVYDPGTQGTFTTITHNDVVINTATPAYNGALGSDGKPAGNAGYTFTGWLPTVSATVTEDVTYVAQWSANVDTAYKVEHYLEQTDGTYKLKETDELTGTTGESVIAVAKSYPGYIPFPLHADAKLSGTVLGDGSLTLKLYYQANTTTGYKVDHYLEQLDGSYVLKETDSLKGTTGHTVTAKAKVYTNYTFDNTVKGTVESGVVAGDESLVLKLYYTIDEAAYTVEHYVEQTDGTYVIQDTENLSELIGTTVTATAKTYTGYRLDSSHVDAIKSGVVAGDGTLVLKLYYKLDDVGYTVEHYHEQTDGSFQLESSDAYVARAGSSVSASAKTYTTHKHDAAHTSTVSTGVVAHDGSLVLRLYYVLEENPSVMPTETTYKVEHYLEQSDGTYILQDTELLPEKIGVNVSATAKDYSGYTFNKEVDGTLLNGVVLEDGSLVLKLYYTKDGKDVTIINPSKANPKQSNSSVSVGDTTNTNVFIVMLMMSGLVVLLRRRKEGIK